MRRAMLRDLRAHRGRAAMTVVAIVLGVTFVVATWVVSDSAAASAAGWSDRTDLAAQITPTGAGDAKLTEALLEEIDRLPGVTGATGVRIGYAVVVGSDGKLVDTFQPGIAGTSWDSSHRFELVAGRAPADDGEIALDRALARDADLSVGATTTLMLDSGRTVAVTVVGVFRYHTAGLELPPSVAVAPQAAPGLLGEGYDRIEIFGSPGQLDLGPLYTVQTATELKAAATKQAERDGDLIRRTLLVFASIALLVGAFVIANTFTILVTQRTRQFALLRAVGARRGQVRQAVLVEAVVLGSVGSVVGIGVGIALGALIMAFVAGTGQTITFVVPARALLVGVAVGVGVTILGAYGSARRAAAMAPVAALGSDSALPPRSLVLRTALGLAAMAGGVGAVLATSSGTFTEQRRMLAMAGALAACVGLLLLAPLLTNALLRPLARLLGERTAPAYRLAVRNAVREPRRTAATATALMIGLALVCAFATVGATATAAYAGAVRASIPSSTIVVQPVLTGSTLDESTVAALGSQTSALVSVDGRLGGEEVGLTGIDPSAIGDLITPPVIAGGGDVAQGILLPVLVLPELQVGDTVEIVFTGDGPARSFTVAGRYEPSGLLRDILVDATQIPASAESTVVAGLAPTTARADLERALAGRPDIEVVDRDDLIGQAVAPVRTLLTIAYGLLAAAVLIAIFGVVNTLALSVIERTREIGVWRAIGASRSTVRTSVRWEGIVIATYGGLLGVVAGILLGGVMQRVLLGRPVLDLAIPYDVAIGGLIGMVVVGVLAAVWPARRAARMDILAAIAVD